MAFNINDKVLILGDFFNKCSGVIFSKNEEKGTYGVLVGIRVDDYRKKFYEYEVAEDSMRLL